MQVDPIKPKLKPPGTKRLKLKHEELLSNFGFQFKSRRYTMGHRRMQNMAQPYKRQLFRFDLTTFAWVSPLFVCFLQ